MSNPDQLPLIPPADARAAELLRIGVEACNAAGADRQLSSGWADTLEWQKDGWRAIARHVDATAVTWIYCDDELPDDDTTVLLAIDDDGSDEVEIGYHSGDRWLLSNCMRARGVYAWAHAPAKPATKGGA